MSAATRSTRSSASKATPSTLTVDDIVTSMRYIINLAEGKSGYQTDDIDHFGNRRIRTVGELIKNQFRIGISRMERVVRERMSTFRTPRTSPHNRSSTSARSSRPSRSSSAPRSCPSSWTRTNPAAGITHKRRLSALGPGGLSRERAGFEVRDVHTSHYGRMCPIETPEGPNIGLIGSLATYARVNDFGFIETPYRRVVDGKVTDDVDYLTADEEENYSIAQANEPFNPDTREFGHFDDDGNFIKAKRAVCRTKNSDGDLRRPGRGAGRGRPVHGRFPAPDELRRNRAHPVPRARRRKPRAHGLQHAASGSAAAASAGTARRHRPRAPHRH